MAGSALKRGMPWNKEAVKPGAHPVVTGSRSAACSVPEQAG